MAVFLFAGHAITSLALTYIVLQLAQHDDVREKLDAEHDTMLGDVSPGLADLNDLTYADQVTRELRREAIQGKFAAVR